MASREARGQEAKQAKRGKSGMGTPKKKITRYFTQPAEEEQDEVQVFRPKLQGVHMRSNSNRGKGGATSYQGRAGQPNHQKTTRYFTQPAEDVQDEVQVFRPKLQGAHMWRSNSNRGKSGATSYQGRAGQPNHQKVRGQPHSQGHQGKGGHLRPEAKSQNPYQGRVPVSKAKMKQHSRGEGIKNFSRIKTKLRQKQLKVAEEKVDFSVEQMARAEILLQEEGGYMVPAKNELTWQVPQKQIVDSVDMLSAVKRFDLNLPQYAPYRFSYTLNGRHLVLGGKKGHLAAFDWVTKRLACELNVMESVHDVQWLHIETMFAAAQKDHVYMYDNNGIELHCIKTLHRVLNMEFLPYHFLLTTASDKGYLSWLDVSIGKLVAQYNGHLGRLDVMCQNPTNAVICTGHAKGVVAMWVPSQRQPVAKILCHAQPVRAITVDSTGRYLATSAVDQSLRIWDVRTFKQLQSYKIGMGAATLSFSQRGLLATGIGNLIHVYKDCCTKQVAGPYIRHKLGRTVTQVEFCPFEDVLGIGHLDGFSSILVPGAGEPNFDALERNPFQTKSQRKEAEVKALLEKVQPEMICLDPHDLGDVDIPTMEEKLEAKKKLLYVRPQKIDFKPRRVHRRGGSVKVAKVKKGHKQEVKLRTVKAALKRRDQFLETKGAAKEKETPKKVLDRFLPKKKKQPMPL